MKVIRSLLILICLGTFLFSAWKLFGTYSEYKKGDDTYKSLEQYVKYPEAEDEEEVIMEETIPEVDFEALQKINPDIVGWIYCPGTHINYPIVQGKSNEDYLHRMFTGEANREGSIFLDYNNNKDFFDIHSILYGHHMKNGSMFHDIAEYKDQAFYEQHPKMYLITPQRDYDVEIFAGYVAKTTEDSWMLFNRQDEDYEKWLQWSMNKSCFNSPVVPTVEDRVLTMSTCSYEFENARFVLLGVLKERN